MKGLILCSGNGTRLYPLTKSIPKALLPLYDKPMVDYSISYLKKLGITEIALIIKPEHFFMFKMQYGDEFELITQSRCEGTPHGLYLARDWIGKDDVVLMFSDNVIIDDNEYYAFAERERVKSCFELCKKGIATNFYITVPTDEAKRFGIIELDNNGTVKSIEEKPEHPKSNCASIGLYIYPNDFKNKLPKLKKSKRGEYEITDLNNMYRKTKKLHAERITSKWFDCGTFQSLFKATETIQFMRHLIK